MSKGLHTAYAFSITVSLLISVIGWFATPALLHLLKTPADVIPDSILYLRIYFLGMIFTLTYNMGSSIMRAIGDSRRPLIYLVICCGINIVLDILFVIVFHMGIAGSAIATVISQGASAILVTRSLMKSYGILKLELRSIRFHGALLKSELKIGLPGGIQSFGYSISNIIIQAVINDFGTDTAAAWAAYGKLDAIFWTVCGSFGIAITTFTGQNYGARKFNRVKKSVRVCLGMALGVCGSLIVFLMVFCRPLYHIFTTDYAVVDIGVYMLRLITPSYVIFIFVEIFSGALWNRRCFDSLYDHPWRRTPCETYMDIICYTDDRRIIHFTVQLPFGMGCYRTSLNSVLFPQAEAGACRIEVPIETPIEISILDV